MSSSRADATFAYQEARDTKTPLTADIPSYTLSSVARSYQHKALGELHRQKVSKYSFLLV